MFKNIEKIQVVESTVDSKYQHTYILSKDKSLMFGYTIKVTGKTVMFSRPFKFDSRNRSFTMIKS